MATPPAVVLVQTVIQGGSGTETLTATAGAAFTVGNYLVVVAAAGDTASPSLGAPSGGGVGTWQTVSDDAVAYGAVMVAMGQVTASGADTVSVVATNSGGTMLGVYEVSGLSGAAGAYQATLGQAGSVVATPSLGASGAAFFVSATAGNADVSSVASPFTIDGTEYFAATGHAIETSGASVVATWTYTAAGTLTALIAAFSGIFAPNAPTLGTPANASTEDMSGTPTFAWVPNPTPGDGAENAIAIRMKQSGASAYSYWNAATGAWQSTIVWNPYTTDSYTFPAGAWADGATYNWSVATQEATYGLQSPFASDFTVTAQLPPVGSVTGPTGVVASAAPTVTWTTTLPAGATVTAYRMVIYSAEQIAASGFAVGGTPSLYDTGTVSYTTASGSVLVPTGSIANNTTVTAYLQITETGGELSAWASGSFTVSYDAPAVPSITATAGTDSSTGCPLVALVVQGHDNLLSFADASFEGSVGSAVVVSNCVLGQSAAQALDGSNSLAAQAVASGAMVFQEGPYPVVAGESYVWLAAYRAASTAESVRVDIAWYDGSTLLSTTEGSVPQDTSAGWTYSVSAPTVAPATATQAYLVHHVLNATGQLATPVAPTVTPEGTTGSSAYDYQVAATTVYGSTPASPAGSTATGNATLSATDYNLVAWDAVQLPAGSPGNLVYDSNLTNAIASVGPTWVGREGSAPTIGTADGDFNVINAGTDSAEWVAYGTGSSVASAAAVIAPGVTVTPGAIYTLSAVLDASNLTAGNMDIQLYNASPGPSTAYIEVSQGPGANGLVSGTVTIPAGVTVVYPACQLDSNWTVTAGATVSWSHISLVEGPAPANLVYDSNLTNAIAATNPTWTVSGASIGTANGDWNVLNPGTDSAEWAYYGTGAAGTGTSSTSKQIDVAPGATYTLSADVDCSAATAGYSFIEVQGVQAGVPNSQANQNNGVTGTISVTVVIPAGVTQVTILCNEGTCEVPAGSTLTFSQIQLTETSTVEPYEPGIVPQPGPLPTYDVYGRTGTLGLLGSTTALAWEDTGAASPGAAAPTVNTSGEVHYVDCAGIMPGDGLGEILTALADAPAVSWELSDAYGSTTAAEELNPGLYGTVNGGVTFGEPGPVAAFPGETAASFDGSTGYISTGFAPNWAAEFGAGILAYPSGLTAGGDIFTMRPSGNAAGLIYNYNTDGTISFGMTVTAGGLNYYTFESTHRPQNTWYALEMGFTTTGGAVLYVDGVAVVTETTWTGDNTSLTDLVIGGGGISHGGWWRGSLAKARTYSTAPTPTRVAARYAALSALGSLVEKWTRGGLVGATTATILRSDGAYVRGASAANPIAIPAATQTAVIDDYETTPTVDYTYTTSARSLVGATADTSSYSAPSGPVATAATTWWTLNPADPTTALALDVQQHQTSRTAQQTAHTVLGPPDTTTYPTIVSSAIGGRDGTLTVETHSATEFAAVEALVNIQSTMWLASPYGDGIYLRYGPQPGGMSSGVGNKTHDTATAPSPATTPVRTTALSYVGQGRPAV